MQRSAVPVEGIEFEDQYGDVRVIHHNKSPNGPLRIKRTSVTPALALNGPVARALGANVRALRVERGYTLLDLAERAGLRGGKQMMHKIETAARGEGVRLGTLFALAMALDVEVASLLPSVAEVSSVARLTKRTNVAVSA